MNKRKTIRHKRLPSKEERLKLFGSVVPGPKSKPIEKDKMADVQNTKEDFLFAIDVVGISNVKHPIIINSHLQPKCQTSIVVFPFTLGFNPINNVTHMSQ